MNNVTVNNPNLQTVTLVGNETNLSLAVPPAQNIQTVAQQSGPNTAAPLLWGNISGNILNQIDLQQEFALQAGIAQTNLNAHTSRVDNPHSVTQAQVGLGNVANLSPDNLPVSIATAAAIAAVQATIPSLPVPINQGGTGAVNAANARTNLGANANGATIFTSASSVGAAVGQASTQAVARGAIGSGTFGDGLFTAISQSAAMVNLGFPLGTPEPVGQCYFQQTSSTVLTLLPFNGNQLFINGAYQTIPSAGVTFTAAGMTAATMYNVYAYMNSGVMTLELSTTARATSTTYGHQIKSGDATRTLVGKAWAATATTFDVVNTLLYVSWFNRRLRTLGASIPSSNYSFTPTTTMTDQTGAVGGRIYAASWGVEPVRWHYQIPVQYGSGTTTVFFDQAQVYNSATTPVLLQGSNYNYSQGPTAGMYGTLNNEIVLLAAESIGPNGTGSTAYVFGGVGISSNIGTGGITLVGPGAGATYMDIWG